MVFYIFFAVVRYISWKEKQRLNLHLPQVIKKLSGQVFNACCKRQVEKKNKISWKNKHILITLEMHWNFEFVNIS